MKTATQNLENDHVLILRLIEVIERITEQSNPKTEHLELIVKLIREFADGIHHLKEEQYLFPLLVQKGFSNEAGPVAAMLQEHIAGRNYVNALADHILLYKQGIEASLTLIYENMLGYAGLLINHIQKENNVLFKMADKLLTAGEQESLLLNFEKAVIDKKGNHSSNDYKTMINSVSRIYTS